MHDFAAYVRQELPGWTWTVYRDPHDPACYLALIRVEDISADARQRDAPGTQAFAAALAPLFAAEPRSASTSSSRRAIWRRGTGRIGDLRRRLPR
jgi:hypothetical protein